jgi:hypothetical protein
VALNNLNASSQEGARDLMNPDELMKLPPNEALILNQGMPAYIAKKVVYYHDKRFKNNAYSRKTIRVYKKFFFIPIPFWYTEKTVTTGFAPPATRRELERETAGLPSNMKKVNVTATTIPVKDSPAVTVRTGRPEPAPEPMNGAEEAGLFNPADYIESFDTVEAFAAPSVVPLEDSEPPPTVIPWQDTDFRGVS